MKVNAKNIFFVSIGFTCLFMAISLGCGVFGEIFNYETKKLGVSFLGVGFCGLAVALTAAAFLVSRNLKDDE